MMMPKCFPLSGWPTDTSWPRPWWWTLSTSSTATLSQPSTTGSVPLSCNNIHWHLGLVRRRVCIFSSFWMGFDVLFEKNTFKTFFLSFLPLMSLILALGDPSEQKVPLAEALVCHQELRCERPAGVREEPLQAGQGVPEQGREWLQVQTDERRQGNKIVNISFQFVQCKGWTGLLQTVRVQVSRPRHHYLSPHWSHHPASSTRSSWRL